MCGSTQQGALWLVRSVLRPEIQHIQRKWIQCTSRGRHMQGFVVGTAKGSFCHFERDEEGAYKCLRVHVVDGGQALRSVVSVAEDTLYALSAAGQLLKVTTAAGKTKAGLRTPLQPQTVSTVGQTMRNP